MLKKELVSTILLFGVSTSLCAEEANDSKYYAGIKGAYSDFSSIDWKVIGSGSWEVEDTAGYGLYSGYKLTDRWAVEIEYLNFETETKDNEFHACSSTTFTCVLSKADYESDTYSVYAAYRTSGDVYFKGRLGYSYQESEFSKSFYNLPTAYESSVSGSVGIGINMQNISIETEYTYSTEFLSHLSVGVALNF